MGSRQVNTKVFPISTMTPYRQSMPYTHGAFPPVATGQHNQIIKLLRREVTSAQPRASAHL